jgi:hypothetical protein
MAYQIDARRVAGVLQETNNALQGKDFNHGEVVLGLAEMIGRIIVSVAKNKIQADEMQEIAVKHMQNTIAIGAQAQDKRIITEF